jgi:hypothetical protein
MNFLNKWNNFYVILLEWINFVSKFIKKEA